MQIYTLLMYTLHCLPWSSHFAAKAAPWFLCLQEVLTKLASLDADLSEKRAKKAQLEADVHMCTVKLDRAQKLIAGLGGEKSRWTAVAGRLGQQFMALTGDIVLAAAQIAYLGETRR